MELVINSGGMGAAQTTNLSPQEIGYCSGSLYWVLPECWGLSHDAWQAAAALPPIPASVVAAPAPPANLTTLPDTTGQTAQDLSNAAMLQTQGNVQGFLDSVPDNPLGTAPCEWMNVSCTTWAIIGAAGLVLLLARR